jgi:glycosyltransferase involved in cell wall biosynthesis
MRCLIVVPSLIRAGAETQSVDLANGLASMGHEVHLCAFEQRLDQRDRLTEAVRFHHILRRSKYDRSVVTGLADVIDRESIEVVQGVLQFATLIAWLASLRSKRKPPVVAAIHTTINRGLKQELHDRLVYRHILRRLASIIYVCDNQRDHWVAKYPELRPLARVVHNGIDVSRFRRAEFLEAAGKVRRELQIPEGAPVFSCIAAFRPEKGHDLLIRAFAKAVSHGYLILAGDGERRKAMEAAASAEGVAARVKFVGNVADVRPYIVASNATILASRAVETFSIAMLESMALGVPVIAPRIGGLPEAVISGKTGLLFDVGDEDALARCIKAIADDPWTAETMGRMAHVVVADKFTAKAMSQKNECVLKAAIRK